MQVDDDARFECTWRHVLCFFMCYDTPRRRAYFWWLMTSVAVSMLALFASHCLAETYGFRHDFSWFWHMVPLLIIASGHLWFMGMSPDEESSAHIDSNVDPLMRRCALASASVFLGMGVAFFLVALPVWFSPEQTEQQYVFGPAPAHAALANVEPAQNNNTNEKRKWGFSSPSVTPSQTPSASPDPRIRRREYYTEVNHRSNVGGVYLISALSTCVGVVLDYNMRMIHMFQG